MFKDRTKELFAEALEQMLLEMPLSKVKVKDLCERVGAQRPTFYYHFKDKYDLVAWIFERDFRSGMGEVPPDAGLQARTEAALNRMWQRHDFYRKAFADKSQNSIERHIQDFDVKMGETAVKRHTGAKKITEQQLFDIKSQSYGSMGYTVEWMRGEVHATPAQLAAWETERMPAFLREAYEATGYYGELG
ncbi:HTH-type dhaKLM operon transcriptional activator dhaS [Slackia heliotrinireducens]|uniref:Transcriptional regulator, tetR family n=1 Tax=Slackia heliotrinireducens (strain ATCC 29202 / DSM 20476 / NCTC 11029 / RHS 1) TaxID=471855 RepID=C7N2Y6_SLAHD|nr:TetR/AcrR family transcriptional regulator C-terminal domain-containing protein [Slackia heliotrinireducens]ACV21507.1 transcriptional regulator, tetR family [Slackia heliotrinireducens DSM 20476]VEG98960.1 HTH-type dhaKLM operon transcriptional activator dhaS [Slackia heliotrinireducens]